MRITERELEIAAPTSAAPLAEVSRSLMAQLPAGGVPIRFAVPSSERTRWRCEVAVIEEIDRERAAGVRSIFELRRRAAEDSREFTAVLVVPTGIGSEIGGHAGDAMPVAALLGSACDTLITHPNVVNGSDIMELPANGLYVEGSVLARLLTGTAGLGRTRANRVLTVIDDHPLRRYVDVAVNSVSAARASLGLDVPEVVTMSPRLDLRSRYTASGRAVGDVEQLETLLAILDGRRGGYDAVAISSLVQVPFSYHGEYYSARGKMVNPWGGAEAILTHAISSLYDVPTAHAPMLESKAVEDLELGVVDPRMAAETISVGFFVCVLKGLQRSPRIVPLRSAPPQGIIGAEQVSCLIIPDRAIGLPTLAALEQGIPVIAVRENRNVLENDLTALPWQPGQLHMVENYWEAAGVMAALRAGIEPRAVRRPLAETRRGEMVVTSEARRATSVPQLDDGRPAIGERR